jgi:hypothetical protein
MDDSKANDMIEYMLSDEFKKLDKQEQLRKVREFIDYLLNNDLPGFLIMSESNNDANEEDLRNLINIIGIDKFSELLLNAFLDNNSAMSAIAKLDTETINDAVEAYRKGNATEEQLRIIKLLKHILKKKGKDFDEFIDNSAEKSAHTSKVLTEGIINILNIFNSRYEYTASISDVLFSTLIMAIQNSNLNGNEMKRFDSPNKERELSNIALSLSYLNQVFDDIITTWKKTLNKDIPDEVIALALLFGSHSLFSANDFDNIPDPIKLLKSLGLNKVPSSKDVEAELAKGHTIDQAIKNIFEKNGSNDESDDKPAPPKWNDDFFDEDDTETDKTDTDERKSVFNDFIEEEKKRLAEESDPKNFLRD